MFYRDDMARQAREAINTVWALIAINVIVYLIGINPDGPLALWANNYQLQNAYPFRPWQLVTYMFLHADFMHILFNMYGLFLFGRMVAPVLGRARFLTLYFTGGIVGGLLHLAANWNSVPLNIAVGASGALFGVMMAAAMIRPNLEMYIMFIPVPVKLKTLVLVYAAIEIFSQWKLNTHVAHLAHLGGFVGAYLYLILCCKRDVVWSLGDLFRSGPRVTQSFDRHAPESSSSDTGKSVDGDGPHPHITHVSQKEVDRLLDKISRDGINSLTDYERAELQFFREQMKNAGR